MQEIIDTEINQDNEILNTVLSFMEKVFKGKPYYSDAGKKNKNVSDKFDKMSKLANKLVAQHMLQEMLKSNKNNPKEGFKISVSDYSTAYFSGNINEDFYYQNIYDKVVYFIKQNIYTIRTMISVYSNLFATIYRTSKDAE